LKENHLKEGIFKYLKGIPIEENFLHYEVSIVQDNLNSSIRKNIVLLNVHLFIVCYASVAVFSSIGKWKQIEG
jgi:hypothetical protein